MNATPPSAETSASARSWVESVEPREAWIKLYTLRQGITVDGTLLAKTVPGYPENYRVKRQRKRSSLINGRLYDVVTEDVPWIPQELFLHFSGGRTSVVKVNYNADSDVTLRCSVDGELSLVHERDAFQVGCSLSKVQLPANFEAVSIIGADRVAILGYEGCSGWLAGKQCRFCDSAAGRPGETSVVPSLNDMPRPATKREIESWLDKAAENYLPRLLPEYASAVERVRPHCHLHLMSGNLAAPDVAWRYHLKLGREMNQCRPLNEVESTLNLLPPSSPEFIENAREIGFNHLLFNMEVWGEESYQQVCPEKAALMPMSRFLERLEQAVTVFGRGNVSCGFVYGAQDPAVLREGCRILCDMGVACNITVFTPKPGTPWEHKERPNINQVADFSLFLASLLKQHEFTPLYCRLSSRSEVIWELLEEERKCVLPGEAKHSKENPC